jgi:hypothetical protein
MSCNQMKRWISDLLDGRLDETKKTLLEKHFSQCPSCRMYRDHLEMIRSGVSGRERTPISLQYREDFSIRLKKQLLSIGKENKPSVFSNWRRIYGPAAASLVIGLIMVLVVFQPRPHLPDELYPFSIGGSLTEIYSDISMSLELEELFNSLVLASIDEVLGDLAWSEETFILKNPLDRYSVTEQDLSRLEYKIKEDLKI